jgi:CheY-like chemotaxis protein
MHCPEKPYRVLIGEDCDNDRVLLKRSLAACRGFRVVGEVSTGQEVLAYLAGKAPYCDRHLHQSPDLLLISGTLPQYDASEILEHLKLNPIANLKVIVFTGSPDPTFYDKMLSLGAHDCYEKTSQLKVRDEHTRQIDSRMQSGHYLRPNFGL